MAVSGAGENDPVPGGNGLQYVCRRVLEADLNRVVIDIADRKLRRDLRHAHRLELQVGAWCP